MRDKHGERLFHITDKGKYWCGTCKRVTVQLVYINGAPYCGRCIPKPDNQLDLWDLDKGDGRQVSETNFYYGSEGIALTAGRKKS